MNIGKKVLALLVVSVALISFLGVGADFRSYDAERSVSVKVVPDDMEFIDLTPVQPYAYISGNGVLVVKFDDNNPNYPGSGGLGVSPNTTYAFDMVFNVSNHLWNNDSTYTICVFVSLSGGAATILDLYSPQDINGYTDPGNSSDSLTFELGLGEEGSVGMVIDTYGQSLGDWQGQISIVAEAGPCPT